MESDNHSILLLLYCTIDFETLQSFMFPLEEKQGRHSTVSCYSQNISRTKHIY